jgi:hypothetical protein
MGNRLADRRRGATADCRALRGRDVDPFAYLREVLERMSNGHPMSRLDDLLPWN